MTNYDSMTKADLIKELQEAKGRLAENTEALRAEVAKKEGWLVTTPEVTYEGTMYGIRFFQGMAFIPMVKVIPAFNLAPLKDSEMERYSAAERKEIREREKIPSSQKAAMAFKNDFGYQVRYYGIEDEAQLQADINARAQEYAIAKAKKEDELADTDLIRPGYMGG